MNIVTLLRAAAMTVLVGNSNLRGEPIERFRSIAALTDQANWVGVVRIEKFVQKEGDLLGFTRRYLCQPVLRLKGLKVNFLTCNLHDGRARSNEQGSIEEQPIGDLFDVGKFYLVFLSIDENSAYSIRTEGAVLPIVPTLHHEQMRGLSIEECFQMAVTFQERYYRDQLNHAIKQRAIFGVK